MRCRLPTTNIVQRVAHTCAHAVVLLLLCSDGTIVSGDSLGRVQFWDLRFGSLLFSFTKHQADVLALAVAPSENAVYAAGVDSQLIEFRRVSVKDSSATDAMPAAASDAGAAAGASRDKWVMTVTVRAHSHDVRALVIGGKRSASSSAASSAAQASTSSEQSSPFGIGGQSESEGFLISGGVDTKLVAYSVTRFAQQGPVSLTPFPHRPCVSLARSSRLLLAHHDKSLHLWRLGAPQPGLCWRLFEFQHVRDSHSRALCVVSV